MLPYFYLSQVPASPRSTVLDEDVSKHIVQVLRMKEGEELHLTDGQGTRYLAVIREAHRKHCLVELVSREDLPFHGNQVKMGISLLKNTGRLEWLLEKATEIGVREIVPLLCSRTEKQKFRYDRMHQILVSAMLQSQQNWLPVLHEPTRYDSFLQMENLGQRKFIAHCAEQDRVSLAASVASFRGAASVLIGPEGDFTPAEIEQALASGFEPVHLGETRLRTETAGLVALTLLRSAATSN